MLGVPLEALGLVVCVALHLAREILGVLLRALGGVLRVAAGVLGRALRLFGQLGRLPLLTRDLLLRLAAQALLKLPLMAQTTAVSAPSCARSSPSCQAWPRWNGLYSLMIPAVRIKIISKWLQFWLLQKNLWLSSRKFLL